MDWATIQTAIVSAAQTALDDPSYDVGWNLREDRWRSLAHVKLRLLSNARKGRDELRYTVEGDDDLREHLYGVRVLRVQFTCEAQDQDLAESAWEIAEAITSGLYETDVREILDTAGIGVSSITSPVGTDYQDTSGRTRSAVTFDVAFNAHTFRTGHLVPNIKKVSFTGEIENGPDIGPEIVEDGLAFPTQHFNIGKIGSPSVAPTPGTPDPGSMAEFSQVHIPNNQIATVIHLHGIEDLGSGAMSIEVYRYRSSVHTLIGSAALTGGGGDFASAAALPSDAVLQPGDYLMAQLTAFSGGGGYDGITVDVHFA